MKMQTFDPLQFNLMERDFFESEKVNIYKNVRLRFRDVEAKVRVLEKFIGHLETISDVKSSQTSIYKLPITPQPESEGSRDATSRDLVTSRSSLSILEYNSPISVIDI